MPGQVLTYLRTRTSQRTGVAEPEASPLTQRVGLRMMNQRVVIHAESSMRAPVSYLLTIVLLIHAAVGCCWHHQHQCVTSCCEGATATAHVCPCDDRHDDDASLPHGGVNEGDQPGNSQHRHEHDCNGDHCTFARTERSPEECGRSFLDVSLPAWSFSCDDGPINLLCIGTCSDSAMRSGDSLRQHLALGILLI